MSEKRRGLGRGLGALIPSSASAGASGNGVPASRPVDLFFPEARKAPETVDTPEVPETEVAKSSPSRGSSFKSTTAAKSPAAKSPAAKVTPAKTTDADRPAGSKPVEAAADASGEAVADSLPSESSEVQLVEVPGARFAEIPVGDIHPNRKQPRSVFDEDDMAELVHSVKEIGVLQPIVVRTSTEKGGEPYELVMGERRWRAVQAAGLETIPAIVRDTTDDDLLRDALLENLHRSQLNPLEEAAAYQQLLEDFGTTHEQLADRIGRSRPQVSNTLRLLKLPPLVQRRVAASVLSAGHARALLALPDAASMERLAQKIVAEGMSVRATEEAVALYQDPTAPPKNSIPRPNARHERLDYLASSLSDRLDTNVKITLGARKGRVSIEFASVEDLNRIMDVLSPGDES
ncbi:ParB/RepB/Spo0J family partition protein [Arthrobacter bambusae]|uniref:ParB/RepB/Spo0J family partition protein n=1 Tax=Arthrobacter bambusae TaxID=1338426 RepID=UPI0027D845A3|nr:ParB/RepB/Spo0J family partition protein [Arthrobacter bambusae]